MLTPNELLVFALVALALVLTPGPNMIYCISRTLCQGRGAGLVSLAGVAFGFLVHLLGASFGLTALLLAAPVAFTALKVVGAAYLMWLAWQAFKPGGQAPFEARELPHDPPRKLLLMGFMTNVLNPKVAMFYISFFPQFLHPERGQVLLQSLSLGAVQISVSMVVNSLLIFSAAGFSAFLNRNAAWMRAQRYVMGSVLAALALRLLTEKRTA
ncbi:MAG: LysE family translocator [Pseudomonadota bacterium]